MSATTHNWAVILAAGDGKRLKSLTTNGSGTPVPKQYCAIERSNTLLEDALCRAASSTDLSRVCTIVASEHREWWRRLRIPLGERNLIVQPADRGTGVGVLLGLMSVLERDPDANVLFLPADHLVRNESVLGEALNRLVQLCDDEGPLLLGISPEGPDPEPGFIVQGRRYGQGRYVVRRFVDRPEPWLARLLVSNGCTWNSQIFASNGRALASLFREFYPDLSTRMRNAVGTAADCADDTALRQLYADVEPIDLSRDVFERCERRLRVLPAPSCGWNDIGTPRSLYRCLSQPRTRAVARGYEPLLGLPAALDLSQTFAALKLSG